MSPISTPHLDPTAPIAVWAGLIAVLLLFGVFTATALLGIARHSYPPETPVSIRSVGNIPTHTPPLS